MSDKQPAPLWSDEQISEEVETLALGYKARHVLRRMRDGYEAMLSMACQTSPSEEAAIARLTQANAELAAEVARLKAELEWEPVPEYKTGHKYGGLYLGGGLVTLWDEDVTITKNLPDNIRLVRLKAEGNR